MAATYLLVLKSNPSGRFPVASTSHHYLLARPNLTLHPAGDHVSIVEAGRKGIGRMAMVVPPQVLFLASLQELE